MSGRSGPTDRLEGLDALRGVAAISVMLHHFMPRLTDMAIAPAGYLSVDFFFILSGFVIDRAYRGAFGAGLSTPAFLTMRLSRLYPTIVVGILLGAAVAFWRGADVAQLAIRLVAQLCFIPIARSDIALFPLDGVQWSLLFEIGANVLHAFLLWKLSTRKLIGIVVLAWAALLFASHEYGSLMIGDRGTNMIGGVPRILFGYVLGVLLHRLSPSWRYSIHPLLLGVGFAGIIAAAGYLQLRLSPWYVDPVIAAIAFPLLIIGGMNAGGGRFARWLGTLSFPLYAVHLPVLDFVEHLALPSATAYLALACGLSLIVAMVIARLLPGGRLRASSRQSAVASSDPLPVSSSPSSGPCPNALPAG